MNTERSRAKNNMRHSGQKKNRPEQLLAAAIIQTHIPTSLAADIETEEIVKCFNADEPGVLKEISVDITVRFLRQRKFPNGDKIAIELNGPPHDELPQIRRDARKQIILEWKGNDWKFLVFDYDSMPNLFLRNERELTPAEAIAAYGEVKDKVSALFPLMPTNSKKIEAVLRKTKLNESDQVS